MERRLSALARLADTLGGEASAYTASGRYEGVPTELLFETRGTSSNTVAWTRIACQLPRGYPLALYVEEHGRDDADRVAVGDMVDVGVGDAEFDRRFRVEGAPVEVVQALLSPEVRAYLMSQRRVEVATADGELRLLVGGWLEDHDAACQAMACATAMARGLRDASLAGDAQLELAPSAVYRGLPDDAPVREARAARAAEVAEVEATRSHRIRRQQAALWFGLLVIVVGGAIVLGLLPP